MATKKWAFRTLTGGAAGSLDSLPVAGLTNLDTANGIVNGLYHPYYYDASSTESENSPYFIIPDDNVSGTGVWVLSGFQGAMSHVFAYKSAVQSIPNNTLTTVELDAEQHDLLGEFDIGTYTFTAKNDGLYRIIAANIFASGSFVTGEYFRNTITAGGTDYSGPDFAFMTNYSVSSPQKFGPPPVDITIELSASDTVISKVLQNQGAAVNINNTIDTRLIIDRIV